MKDRIVPLLGTVFFLAFSLDVGTKDTLLNWELEAK